MYEKNKVDLETNPFFDSIYMKEERKETKYNRINYRNEETYSTTIISFSKDNYQYHYENYIENKTTDSKRTLLEDMYIKDEKLHFFSTLILNKRVAYKVYYICDLDYVWSYDSEYIGHLEEVLGDEYIKRRTFSIYKE